MDKKSKKKLLLELKQKMLKDKSLPLRDTAKNLVFGDGNPDAKVLFIGEGPGYWEDKKGIPFVGNSGSLLNLLLYSIKLLRKDVFITNIIHYHPPNNRDPQPHEIKAFEPYLEKIIDIINPKIIVTLGRFSMGKFLVNTKINSVHGKKFEVLWKGRNLVVVPMFHPAAGLRNESIKTKLFEDFKKLAVIIEEESKEKTGNINEVEQMKLV